MGTPFQEIGKAYLKAGAKKTQDLVTEGATGHFKTEAQESALKEVSIPSEPTEIKPQEVVEPAVEAPIEPIAEAPTTTPSKDEVQTAEAITQPTDLEMGLPSGDDASARNINFDNITESDEVLTIIDNIGKQNKEFVDARGGVVSHEQTIKESSKVELEEILGFKLGDGVSPARVTGARIALTDSASKLQGMAKKILDGDASTTEKVEFRQAVSTHVAIQQSVAGMSAEAGRSLNAFKIPAQAGMGTGGKTAVFRSQLQDVFESTGGDKTIDKMAEYIEEAGDDLAELGKRTAKSHNATSGDMILEYWINGILSSPATHMVNVTSNMMVALWSIPERLLASGIGKIWRSAEGVEAQEAVGQMFGLMQGFRDGLKMGGQALKTGEPTDPTMKLEARKYRAITSANMGMTKETGKSLDKFVAPIHKAGRGVRDRVRSVTGKSPVSAPINTDGYMAKGVDLLGNALRMPGRLLGAEDEMFKAISYRMELNALAYRKATGEGLEGKELGERIVEIINNPTEEIHLASSDIARVQTFTNPLGEIGQKVQRVANAHPIFKIVLPFVRTPVNIVKFVGMRSPFAPFAKSFQADMKAGGARQAMALSKMSLGTSLLTLGMSMASDGTITGKAPKNKSHRDALRRQGWQEYSIKIGDKYYSYNRTDPIGMFFGLSADVLEVIKYAEDDADALDLATASFIALAKNLTSRTYLRGLSETLVVLDDPDRYKDRYFARLAASFAPYTSLTANIERTMDPTLRATYDLMDQIKGRTPGLSDSLPPRRNVYGEPIVLEGGLGWDFVSPIYSSTRKPDIVDNEIIENEMTLTMPRRMIGSGNFAIELNAEEYDRLVVLAGKELKRPFYNPKTGSTKDLGFYKYLRAVIMSDMYQNASPGPDGGKSLIVRIETNAFRDMAKRTLLDESPALKAEWDYQQEQKIEAKTGQPIEELLEGY